MMATDMGLVDARSGPAISILFAKMTGIEFHVEGPVGQFAIGRGREPGGLATGAAPGAPPVGPFTQAVCPP